jgi:hypothetical protein
MTEPVSTFTAAVIYPKIVTFATAMLPALLGSILGMRIYPERTWKAHATAIFAAGCLSYYGVGGLADYFDFKAGLFLELCKFVVGLYGFTVVLTLSVQIPLAIAGLRAKYTGGTQ